MLNDFNLSKLPGYGKLFVALYTLLVILVVIWMTILGAMEAGIIGDMGPYDDEMELAGEYEPYDDNEDEEAAAAEDYDELLIEDSAVTPPQWGDSGEQEDIAMADTEMFAGPEEEEEYEEEYEGYVEDEDITFWLHFNENMRAAIEHLSSQAMLFFGLGIFFLFSGYSKGTKKLFFWILGILIGLHLLGISGQGFCWPADLLTYSAGPLILIGFFIMGIMILAGLGQKNE